MFFNYQEWEAATHSFFHCPVLSPCGCWVSYEYTSSISLFIAFTSWLIKCLSEIVVILPNDFLLAGYMVNISIWLLVIFFSQAMYFWNLRIFCRFIVVVKFVPCVYFLFDKMPQRNFCCFFFHRSIFHPHVTVGYGARIPQAYN